LLFGLLIYMQYKNLPCIARMKEISELIYETCKTYLITQGKFIMILWGVIAVIVVATSHSASGARASGSADCAMILFFSLVGIAGRYGVAWFGIRVKHLRQFRAPRSPVWEESLTRCMQFH